MDNSRPAGTSREPGGDPGAASHSRSRVFQYACYERLNERRLLRSRTLDIALSPRRNRSSPPQRLSQGALAVRFHPSPVRGPGTGGDVMTELPPGPHLEHLRHGLVSFCVRPKRATPMLLADERRFGASHPFGDPARDRSPVRLEELAGASALRRGPRRATRRAGIVWPEP